MKINKRTLSCIATLVIIAIAVSPSIIQRAMILDNGDGDDDESFLLITPPTPPSESNNTFPEDYFVFINNIAFILGDNASGYINNKTELKYIDDELYEVQAEWDLSYEFNIEFEYPLLNSFTTNHNYFDYYDLFLYLQIDSSINPQPVYFQGFNGIEWYDITEINNIKIDLNRIPLENTIKFRVYGSVLSQKIIPIERLCILFQHNKEHHASFRSENIGSTLLDHSEVNLGSGNTYFNYNPNWWNVNNRNDEIKQEAQDVWGSVGTRKSHTELEIKMQLSNVDELQLGFNVKSLKVETYLDGSCTPPTQYRDYYTKAILWNYALGKNGGWDSSSLISYRPIPSFSSKPDWMDTYMTFDWTSFLKNNPNYLDYFDLNSGTWKFKIYSHSQDYIGWAWVYTRVYPYYCEAILDSQYYGYDYQDIEVYTNPTTPISTLEDFEIRADIYPSSITYITKTEFYIENLSSEWELMSQESPFIWNSDELSLINFPNGQYIVWVNTTDNWGLSTLNYHIFDIYNSYSEINFINPQFEGEIITQFYNYNINISIFDVEGDEYETPKILIYKTNISEPIIDWTIMDFNGFNITLPPPALQHYYNYSFDPLDFSNGLYTIRILTNDTRQMDFYNEIKIIIINNPPSIEILQPNIPELITPMDWLIECNITNEDPINTAQWDIVIDLNANFTWNDLSYNGTTKLWEANFSLLNYEYGDYLLVINATDDKHNSSLEIKNIQFHPLIAYHFEESYLFYNDNGITVFSNELITTDIIAEINIIHHSIVKERDFEIYIPEKFEDATNYYINHGFDTYTPLGYFPEGTYTKWQIIDYRGLDTVFFNLEKPRLINELIEEDDDDVITMEFTLTSKHSFTNLHIENQLTKYITDPDNYIYTLYYLYAGDWEEVDDYDVEADVFPEFSFTWTYIGEDSVIRFRFKLEPIETEPSNMGGYIFFGFGILALVNVPFQIFGLATKKFRSRTEGEGWGMARYVGISIALAVGSFFGGFGIGYFIYG